MNELKDYLAKAKQNYIYSKNEKFDYEDIYQNRVDLFRMMLLAKGSFNQEKFHEYCKKNNDIDFYNLGLHEINYLKANKFIDSSNVLLSEKKDELFEYQKRFIDRFDFIRYEHENIDSAVNFDLGSVDEFDNFLKFSAIVNSSNFGGVVDSYHHYFAPHLQFVRSAKVWSAFADKNNLKLDFIHNEQINVKEPMFIKNKLVGFSTVSYFDINGINGLDYQDINIDKVNHSELFERLKAVLANKQYLFDKTHVSDIQNSNLSDEDKIYEITKNLSQLYFFDKTEQNVFENLFLKKIGIDKKIKDFDLNNFSKQNMRSVYRVFSSLSNELNLFSIQNNNKIDENFFFKLGKDKTIGSNIQKITDKLSEENKKLFLAGIDYTNISLKNNVQLAHDIMKQNSFSIKTNYENLFLATKTIEIKNGFFKGHKFDIDVNTSDTEAVNIICQNALGDIVEDQLKKEILFKTKKGLLNELNKNEELFKREYLDENRRFSDGERYSQTSQTTQRGRSGVQELSDEQSGDGIRQDEHSDGSGILRTRSLGDSEQRDSLSLVNEKYRDLFKNANLGEFEHTVTKEKLNKMVLTKKLNKSEFNEFRKYVKDNDLGYYSRYAKGFIITDDLLFEELKELSQEDTFEKDNSQNILKESEIPKEEVVDNTLESVNNLQNSGIVKEKSPKEVQADKVNEFIDDLDNKLVVESSFEIIDNARKDGSLSIQQVGSERIVVTNYNINKSLEYSTREMLDKDDIRKILNDLILKPKKEDNNVNINLSYDEQIAILNKIKSHKVMQKILNDSFGGVMYDVSNANKYDTTELLSLWNKLSSGVKESAGGIVTGAMRFILDNQTLESNINENSKEVEHSETNRELKTQHSKLNTNISLSLDEAKKAHRKFKSVCKNLNLDVLLKDSLYNLLNGKNEFVNILDTKKDEFVYVTDFSLFGVHYEGQKLDNYKSEILASSEYKRYLNEYYFSQNEKNLLDNAAAKNNMQLKYEDKIYKKMVTVTRKEAVSEANSTKTLILKDGMNVNDLVKSIENFRREYNTIENDLANRIDNQTIESKKGEDNKKVEHSETNSQLKTQDSELKIDKGLAYDKADPKLIKNAEFIKKRTGLDYKIDHYQSATFLTDKIEFNFDDNGRGFSLFRPIDNKEGWSVKERWLSSDLNRKRFIERINSALEEDRIVKEGEDEKQTKQSEVNPEFKILNSKFTINEVNSKYDNLSQDEFSKYLHDNFDEVKKHSEELSDILDSKISGRSSTIAKELGFINDNFDEAYDGAGNDWFVHANFDMNKNRTNNVGATIFGIEDRFEPLDNYIEKIKNSEEYRDLFKKSQKIYTDLESKVNISETLDEINNLKIEIENTLSNRYITPYHQEAIKKHLNSGIRRVERIAEKEAKFNKQASDVVLNKTIDENNIEKYYATFNKKQLEEFSSIIDKKLRGERGEHIKNLLTSELGMKGLQSRDDKNKIFKLGTPRYETEYNDKGTSVIGIKYFGVKDTMQPFDELIGDIKQSDIFRNYKDSLNKNIDLNIDNKFDYEIKKNDTLIIKNLKEFYNSDEIKDKFINKQVQWDIFAGDYIFNLNNNEHLELIKNELENKNTTAHEQTPKPSNNNEILDTVSDILIFKENKAGKLYGTIFKDKNYAKLTSLEIRRSLQGQNYGSQLVKEFEDECLKYNITDVRIDAYVNSLGFWIKKGYTVDVSPQIIDGNKQDYHDGKKTLINPKYDVKNNIDEILSVYDKLEYNQFSDDKFNWEMSLNYTDNNDNQIKYDNESHIFWQMVNADIKNGTFDKKNLVFDVYKSTDEKDIFHLEIPVFDYKKLSDKIVPDYVVNNYNGKEVEHSETNPDLNTQKSTLKTNEEIRFMYGLTQRPAEIGSVPDEFQIEKFDYPNKKLRHGVISYDRELSGDELNKYEIIDLSEIHFNEVRDILIDTLIERYGEAWNNKIAGTKHSVDIIRGKYFDFNYDKKVDPVRINELINAVNLGISEKLKEDEKVNLNPFSLKNREELVTKAIRDEANIENLAHYQAPIVIREYREPTKEDTELGHIYGGDLITGQTIFGVKDNGQTIENYIKEIKESNLYRYFVENISEKASNKYLQTDSIFHDFNNKVKTLDDFKKVVLESTQNSKFTINEVNSKYDNLSQDEFSKYLHDNFDEVKKHSEELSDILDSKISGRSSAIAKELGFINDNFDEAYDGAGNDWFVHANFDMNKNRTNNVGATIFGIEDRFEPLDNYIEKIKNSEEYRDSLNKNVKNKSNTNRISKEVEHSKTNSELKTQNSELKINYYHSPRYRKFKDDLLKVSDKKELSNLNYEIIREYTSNFVGESDGSFSEYQELKKMVLKKSDVIEEKIETNKTKIIKEVMAISSGTMASLFNTNKLDEIDVIQNDIVKFVSNSSKTFSIWQDVINEYKISNQTIESKKDKNSKEVDHSKTNSELKPQNSTLKTNNKDNFVINENISSGGAKTKFKNYIAGIEVLRKVENGESLEKNEKLTLAKMPGVGTIAAAFYRTDGSVSKGWEEEAQILKDTLTDEEYEDASRGVLDAYYTDETVIKAMWNGLNNLGFNSGAVLEPSCGVGSFFGNMPTKFKGNVKLIGVELDKRSAMVSQALYPKAKIYNMGYENFTTIEGLRANVVIGNPPYGSHKISDTSNKRLDGKNIHNYFMAKGIDDLEDGGLMTMVVSSSFMDSIDSSTRAYIGERANLINAIRLPKGAFGNANTEVVTDILFLQKVKHGDTNISEWLGLGEVNDTPINKYFETHQSNLLGTWGKFGSMYRGDEPALIMDKNMDLSTELNKAINKMNIKVYSSHQKGLRDNLNHDSNDTFGNDARVYSYFIHENTIYMRLPDINNEINIKEVTTKNNSKGEEVALSNKEIDRLKAMIELCKIGVELRDMQLDLDVEDLNLENKRKELNIHYDDFRKRFGFLNGQTNKNLFKNDVNSPFLLSLEKDYDKTNKVLNIKENALKSDIFFKRTQVPYQIPDKAENLIDAFNISLNEKGDLDFEYMNDLLNGKGYTQNKIIQELSNKDFIFEDISDGWVTKEEFLSGNVKEKYKNETNPKNIAALEKILPKDIPAIDIQVTCGASWIPKNDVENFVNDVFKEQGNSVFYNKFNAKWKLSNIRFNSVAENSFSTNRVSISRIMEAALNGTTIEVFDTVIGEDGKDKRVLNNEESMLANEKVDTVKMQWDDWIWNDSERRERLGKYYNDTFNVHVQRKFNGKHLTLPGKVDDSIIELRPHQKNGVWRTSQNSINLFDHTVGAGKTFAAIASVMEMKRTGQAHKPLVCVPNHLVEQWGDDWMKLYPNAKILVPSKNDFTSVNRKILMNKIATGDYDAVIIAHSQLTKIENDNAFETKMIKNEIDELNYSIDQVRREEGDSSRSFKDVMRFKKSLEIKLQKALNKESKDDNITFLQMGIDALILDESHEFKNLQFTTGMKKVKGLGNQVGSQKAYDLFIKTRMLAEKTGGKNLLFLTGTPISNSLAELYSLQKYLQYDELERMGLLHFDAWVKQFATTVTDWELSASGQYKLATRLAKFINMPELMGMYKSFADVITTDMVNEMMQEQGKSLDLPNIRGGAPKNIIADRSDDQANYFGEKNSEGKYQEGSLIYRSENLSGKAQKGEDNMLKIFGDGRKASLDMRMIDPMYGDAGESKVNEAIKKTKEIYDNTEDIKGVQLVFCDLSTPKSGNQEITKQYLLDLIQKAEAGIDKAINELDEYNEDQINDILHGNSFSVYQDYKNKLIEMGVPEKNIAFIHDAKTDIQKQALFDKVNAGDIRILLGSTSKMGSGMNVQKRLVALHHLDVPWRPSDLEQREGRIIRQGNLFVALHKEIDNCLKINMPFEKNSKLKNVLDELQLSDTVFNSFVEKVKNGEDNFTIDINRYATKHTLDSGLWEKIEAKAKFIHQLKVGDKINREADDIGSEAMSASEMKAMSSGDERILQLHKLETNIRKLQALKKNHNRNLFDVESNMKIYERTIENYDDRKKELLNDIALVDKYKFYISEKREAWEQGRIKWKKDGKKVKDYPVFNDFEFKDVDGKMVDRKGFIALVHKALQVSKNDSEIEIGKFAGFDVSVSSSNDYHSYLNLETENNSYSTSTFKNDNLSGIASRLIFGLEEPQKRLDNLEYHYKHAQKELPLLQSIGKEFGDNEKLELLIHERNRLRNELQKKSVSADKNKSVEIDKDSKFKKVVTPEWVEKNPNVSAIELVQSGRGRVDLGVIDKLEDFRFVGNCLVLDKEIKRDDYVQFQKIFTKFGGEWDKKKGAIVFSDDGLNRIKELLNGQNENISTVELAQKDESELSKLEELKKEVFDALEFNDIEKLEEIEEYLTNKYDGYSDPMDRDSSIFGKEIEKISEKIIELQTEPHEDINVKEFNNIYKKTQGNNPRMK